MAYGRVSHRSNAAYMFCQTRSLGRRSGASDPVGDLVKLFARKECFGGEDAGDLVDDSLCVARGHRVLYAAIEDQFRIGDRSLSRQGGEQLLELDLLAGSDFSEGDAHAEKGVGDAHDALQLNPYAQGADHDVGLGIDREGGSHFDVTAMQADVGDRAPHAHVAALGAELRAARAAITRTAAPLLAGWRARSGRIRGRFRRVRILSLWPVRILLELAQVAYALVAFARVWSQARLLGIDVRVHWNTTSENALSKVSSVDRKKYFSGSPKRPEKERRRRE